MSLNRLLPGVNQNAVLGTDDLAFADDVWADEIRRTRRLLMATFRASGARYGIAAETDPATATAEVVSPLLVRRNSSDPQRIDVLAGEAVTPTGDIVFLAEDQLARQVDSVLVAGDQYVVFLEYDVEDDDTTNERNEYGEAVARLRRRTADADTLRVERFDRFQNSSLYSYDRKQHIVALAHLTVVRDTVTTLRVDVSLDRTLLTDNRPWFSVKALEHEALKGTGSSTVPHSLSYNDLSSAGLTLYQQMCRHGQILARDSSYPGVPGTVCSEVIDSFSNDSTGAVTGTIGAKYFELSRVPVRLLGCSDKNTPDREIAARLIFGTNLLVLHPNEYVGVNGATVYYAAVRAGEPDVKEILNGEVTFGQPEDGEELVIAGGKAHKTLLPTFTDRYGRSRTKVSLGLAGPFPRRYRVLVDGTGQLLLSPQILMCAAQIERLGTADFPLTAAPVGTARIIVGLTNTPVDGAMNLTIRVSGKSTAGTQITEDVTFTNATYSPVPSIPTTQDVPGYFQSTQSQFAADTVTIKVLTKTAISASALIMVLADVDVTTSPQLRDACPLAEIAWNGQSIGRIRRISPITSALGAEPTATSPLRDAARAMLGAVSYHATARAHEVLVDDFRDPHFASVARGKQKVTRGADGLRSTMLPVNPEAESDASLEDCYYSQAITLPDEVARNLQVVLFGLDATDFRHDVGEGITPIVQYRLGQQAGNAWGAWTTIPQTDSGDGMSYFARLSDGFTTAFKIQFRVKGTAVGIAAFLRAADAYARVQTLTDAATIQTDASLGTCFLVTLGASRTLGAPTNLLAGQQYRWIVQTGGNALSFAPIFRWTGGLAPTVNQNTAVITAVFDGSNLLASATTNIS